jgi:PAS domain-containing protein
LSRRTITPDAAASLAAVVEAPAAPPREDFYRRLIEGMRCGILVIERSGAVVMVNAKNKTCGAVVIL